MSHTAEDDSKKAQEKEDRKNEERQRIDVYEVWNEVQRTVNREKIEYENAKRTAPYWKTVRIFVSSTFRDFHTEREELVKKVSKLHIFELCIFDAYTVYYLGLEPVHHEQMI